jgi:hypothetical protein
VSGFSRTVIGSDASVTPTRYTYAGLFFVALATLMYEILLTRIFSVTMWYHFAFVAISVAMFGMTVGALVVYLAPRLFTREATERHLAWAAVVLPIAMVLSFLTQLSVPFLIHPSIVALFAIGFTYAVISVPFVASGIAVCLALTRFSRKVSQLYATDLAGAALGCVLLVYVLRLTDGPTAVLVVAFLAGIGGWCFARDTTSKRLQRLAGVTVGAIGLAAGGHAVLVWNEFPILRILYIKGALEARPLYETWNSYSRVRVNGRPDVPETPYMWGLSTAYPTDRTVRQLHLDIDVNAGTVLTHFDGRFDGLEHLKYDVTNIGYYLRPNGRALVVGTGGGRDILSALAFGASSVTGVEINEQIIDTVNGRFGDFTGHLDRDPRVTFVNDEARSYIARQKDRYDMIQVSLIDTWAATAAGAFVLSENSLYTVEAWRIFLERLTPTGLLSVSRWYFQERPGEVYRLVSLASAALQQSGVQQPRAHIAVVRNVRRADGSAQPDGVGTMLVSRSPLSGRDLDVLDEVSGRLQFQNVLTPQRSVDETFAALASGVDLDGFTARYPINIAPPTDDSPFFFHMLRLRDMLDLGLLRAGKSSINMAAVFVLGALVATVVILSGLCIVVPLALTSEKGATRGAAPLLWFFAAIGTGFMLVETSQMQRLIIVLGHPAYGLSVVLFALLLSSGLGSYLTSGVKADALMRVGVKCLVALVATIAIFGLLTPVVTRAFEASTTPVRITIAVLLLFPLGAFMGMAFPLGMKLAAARAPSLTPWLWGINGALSVCASVLAVAIALSWTISAAFWTGWAAYAVALGAYVWAGRTARAPALAHEGTLPTGRSAAL